MQSFSNKDFDRELHDLVSGLRKDIEAKSLGLDSSPEAIKERRKRVLKDGDFKFFAYTYFPHHIFGKPSKFQAHFCKRFPQLLKLKHGVRDWWVAPRGEAKSSLLTKIGPVWITVQGLLENPKVRKELNWQGVRPLFNDYIVLLGAETKLPTKLIEVVKTELTANAALALDFPEACGATTLWRIGEIVTNTNVKIESFGAEQAIRGTFHGASRPKILLGDDLITDKEAKSPTERKNRWNWLENSVDYLGPPDGSVKYLGVGTILNKDDPISRAKRTIGHIVHHFKAIIQMPDRLDLWDKCQEIMLNDDEKVAKSIEKNGTVAKDSDLPSFQFYKRNKKVMDNGAITSWPSVRSLFWLMKQRAKNIKSFGTEMQGEARSDEDKVFTDLHFWVNKLADWIMFGACDPSMGKGETADPSAILVGGFSLANLKLHIELADIKRRLISKLGSDLIVVQREFNCQAIGFENNNAYEHSRLTFINDALKQGVILPLIGVTATVPPEVRIDSMEPFINGIGHRVLFNKSSLRLLEELDTWPEKQNHHHYDGLTALQILWVIAVTRAGGIPNIASRGVRNRTNTRGF